jgi:hypothetical protein
MNCLKTLNIDIEKKQIFDNNEFIDYKKMSIENNKEEYLKIKKKLSNFKPREYKNFLDENQIIFIDSIYLLKYYNKNLPKNQQDVFRNVFQEKNYHEKHRSYCDCLDLFKIIQKIFENNYNKFFENLINFIQNNNNGIYLIGDLNKLNK